MPTDSGVLFGVLADSWVTPASRRFLRRPRRILGSSGVPPFLRRPADSWVTPASRRFLRRPADSWVTPASRRFPLQNVVGENHPYFDVQLPTGGTPALPRIRRERRKRPQNRRDAGATQEPARTPNKTKKPAGRRRYPESGEDAGKD